MGRMYLRPGIPDNDNREYLPEKLKGSEIVVNENGNNSQPYPQNLQEFHGVVADGLEDEWYVYVPDSYSPDKKTPLVISLHGGMMTGWGRPCIHHGHWRLIGMVLLLYFRMRIITDFGRFNGIRGSGGGLVKRRCRGAMEGEPPGVHSCPKDISENHDIRMILGLIELMKKTYNIDAGRIFMQGMSMGNMMTDLFARNFGNILAGAAGSGAAAFLPLIYDDRGKIINTSGPLAIWQSRPEKNDIPPDRELEKKVHKYNRLYWMRLNECEYIPQITIQGENNLAFYKGEKADVVYYDIKNRDHGQTFDDAALVWDYLFSGIRREKDGKIVMLPSVRERKGDTFAFAVAVGSSKAWYENHVEEMTGKVRRWKKMKYHGLDGGKKSEGSIIWFRFLFWQMYFRQS